MATINIPDSMVPEGYELTGEYRCPKEGEYINATDPDTGKPFAELAEFNYKCCLHAILRRKPRLKQIVFTVAGEPTKLIAAGTWYLNASWEPTLQINSGELHSPMVPLTREEVYE